MRRGRPAEFDIQLVLQGTADESAGIELVVYSLDVRIPGHAASYTSLSDESESGAE